MRLPWGKPGELRPCGTQEVRAHRYSAIVTRHEMLPLMYNRHPLV